MAGYYPFNRLDRNCNPTLHKPKLHLLVQCQQRKLNNHLWNLFNVNKIRHQFWCFNLWEQILCSYNFMKFHCWLWGNKCRLESRWYFRLYSRQYIQIIFRLYSRRFVECAFIQLNFRKTKWSCAYVAPIVIIGVWF